MSNNFMTSEPITQNHIQQTLFAEVFPVSQSQTRENAKGSQRLQNLVCGTNSTESFAYYDRNMSSWKTCQQSFLTDLESFSETWPRQGITVNGVAYQRHLLEPVTRETGGGLLPTPLASAMDRKSKFKQGGTPLLGALLPTPRASEWKGVGKVGSKSSLDWEKKNYLSGVINETCSPLNGEATHLNPSFVEEMMGYPIGYTDLKH